MARRLLDRLEVSVVHRPEFLTKFRCNVDTGNNDDMRTVVKKWGNSASVRIPAAIMAATHLDLDDAVDVREEAGRIVIEPVQRKEYDLAELVKGITPENLHSEADFSKPVGKEAL